jgi:hypothetical protein
MKPRSLDIAGATNKPSGTERPQPHGYTSDLAKAGALMKEAGAEAGFIEAAAPVAVAG